MFVNAPIHDMVIRIKNAYLARRTVVSLVQYSSYKERFLNLLKRYDYISWFDVIVDEKNPNKKSIRIFLLEVDNPVEDIPSIRFFSTPSRKWYVGSDQLKLVAWWQGIGVISTSKWLMTVHQAKSMGIGWELILEIY